MILNSQALAQPSTGTSTFDGAFLQIAGFGASPRSGSLNGWTFTSVGGRNYEAGNGFTSRNFSKISMSMQTPTYYSIASDDGSEFQLDYINIEFFFLGTTTYTITGYRDGSAVSGAVFSESVIYADDKFIDVSSDSDFDNIDEFRLSFSISPPSSSIRIDDITISAAAASNSAPTASSFTASNGPYEDLTYTFSTSDFGYSDGDEDLLDHLFIESIPAAGTLYVDADNDDVFDGGEELSASNQVSKADLDAGNLQYIQNGSANTSFQFEVNDGTDNSTGNYVATLNVSPIPTVKLSLSSSSRIESVSTNTTVTASLSNAYGANTDISLGFSGTATNSSDYTRSGSSISITTGSTTGSITISNLPDALYEGDETVVIDITGVSGGIEDGMQQETFTITDDDPQPNASLLLRDGYDPITDESGGQAYIVTELNAVAGIPVTVPLSFSGTATGGGTDYSISSSSIVLSAGEVRDSMLVTSVFDGIEEGDETVIIDMESPTNATEDGTEQVTLTIKDEDAAPPSGYSVSIDQSAINAANEDAVSFTFASAEVGATYNYTFSSSGGGTNVTGSGTIATTTDQVTGIDVSGLGDGTITLAVSLTDEAGNTGSAAMDTKTKYTAVNSPPVLGNLNGDNVSLQPGEVKVIDKGNDVTVSDSDSPDFDGGYFQITDTGNNNTADGDFSLAGTTATSGSDGVFAEGEDIYISSEKIGSINASNDGQAGQILRIVFNSSATPAHIQTLIRNLQWGASAGSGAQTFTLYIRDGDGTKNSGDDDTEVNFAMTLGNPPMVSHLNGDEVDFIEGGSPVLLDAGPEATISDADSPANYNGGNLNATVSSGAAAAEDILTLSIGGAVSMKTTTAGSPVAVDGTTVGTLANNIAEGNDLRINFNSDATLSRVQELLRAIQYANNASPVAENSRQVTVTVTDNANLTSSAKTITINTLLRPEASESRVLIENNSEYTFKPSDFGINDAEYSIRIESIPANGSLKLDGSDVSAGNEIDISSIENHLLTWSDGSDEYGYGYTDFDFKVIDDGDLESAESYTLSIDVGIRTVQLTEGKGWRFLSSSSSDDDYASIFNGVNVDLPPATYPSLYELDQSAYAWDPVENLSKTTERGEAFIFYQKVGEGPVTLSFDGAWTDLSDLFEYSGLNYDETGESTNPGNFYLVGNPHPVALNFCEFALTDVSQAITFWDPETGAGDYVSESCDIEKGIEIAPFQSFWIRTTDVHPTASIPEEAYVNTSPEGYFKKNSSGDSDQPLITLNLTSEDNAFSNQLHILFSDEAKDGLDPMDVPKLSASSLVSEWLSFYSKDSESNNYAIQALPYPDSGSQISSGDEQNQTVLRIPLNVETTEDGFFKMDWKLSDLSALDADVYLIDNTTGNTIDLNRQNQYSFMLNPTSEKAKDQKQRKISENQPFAKLADYKQDARFILVIDYGVREQDMVDINLPQKFQLQQNYPNPFNPVTVIQFQLADQSKVELSVYDLTGREVATLVNKPMQAGNHQVNFNAQDLSSGVYIYTLKAGAQMMSRKLTIVK
ncbi:MAG: T9SS type A sorting domain-containing protein [Balneolaceae bacterium]|nr:T9SS type A sorting domain-containing protein [Balneolaceae bacterium]